MNPLLLALIISLIQFVVVQLPHIDPEYPAETFLAGNLQIIVVIGVYQLINKYIYITKD